MSHFIDFIRLSMTILGLTCCLSARADHPAAIDREMQNPLRDQSYREDLRRLAPFCDHAGNVEMISDMPLIHGQANSPKFRYFFQHRKQDPKQMTILFLPGGPGFGAFRSEFLPYKYNEIDIDPRGVQCNFGEESDFPAAAMTTEQAAGDVAEVIRRLNLSNYVIYAGSYGTMVATMLASQLAQQRIPLPKAIVLQGTLGHAVTAEEWQDAHIHQVDLFFEQNPEVKKIFLREPLPLGFSNYFWSGILNDIGNNWKLFGDGLRGLTPDGDKTAVSELSFQHVNFSDQPIPFSHWPGSYVEKFIACHELSPSMKMQLTYPVLRDGKIAFEQKPNAPEDICSPGDLTAPYDSSKYQITVPILYFQGLHDTQTIIQQAHYHFQHQTNTPFKKFIEVKNGGHFILNSFLRNCADEIWDQIARDDYHFEQILTENNDCRQ